jgi:hypothetical protein
MHKLYLVFLFFISLSCLAQEEVTSVINNLKTSESLIKSTFASVNEFNDGFSVYLQDSDSVYGYLFNAKYENISKIKTEALRNKYKVFLGSTANNLVHYIYFSNNKNTKFSAHSFDFHNKIALRKEIDLSIENEKFLQAFTYKNIFYILSIGKDQSLIYLYVFDQSNYTRQIINLSEITFLSWLKQKTSLYNVLNREGTFSKIVKDIPNSIKNSFKYSKLYLSNDKLVITLDQRFEFTEMISINLKDYSHTFETINHNQEDDLNLIFKRSNSFLVDSLLFQASIIKEKFVFSIKNINSKKALKEISFNRDKILSFENPNAIPDKKNKKKAKHFLRNFTNNIAGIDIQKHDNTYQVKIGSYKNVPNNMFPTIGFSSFSSNGSNIISFTPGQLSFDFMSYYSNGDISENTIEVVLNDNFEFKNDKLAKNVFDKIKEFSEKKSKFIEAENIFNYKDDMFFCAQIKDSKSFLIVKFEN